MLDAVRRGDLEAVKRILATNKKLVSAKDDAGVSAYALAIQGGNQEIADLLKASGYQADLHEAALAQDWERFDAICNSMDDQRVIKQVNSDHPIGER